MSDPYEKAKGARLTFKGGALATRKSIDKKHKKHSKKLKDKDVDNLDGSDASQPSADAPSDAGTAGETYTIDAAKRLNYGQLFPVEAKKFGYDPKSTLKTVEDALDDRVKKKADRYCK